MAVSAHLGIPLDEYDARIRTFIPWYDDMLRLVADALSAVASRAPVVIDLGIGSGAVAKACVDRVPRARVVGLDADADIVAMAQRRLGKRLTTVVGNFETTPLPPCDAVVSAFALHHVPTPARKLKLYRRVHRALRAGGTLIVADCQLSSSAQLAAADRRAWLAHLNQHYTPAQSRGFLRAWAKEDFYFSLNDELQLLRRAGFTPNVTWRRHSFAVIAANS